MPTVLISAGDASGDGHAAGLATKLRERVPDVRLVGLGGDALRKAGVELIADQGDLAVGGLVELLGSAARVGRAWRRTNAALRALRPDLLVLVDSAGFNLPLARRARRLGGTRVLYYVAPQIWAWRPGRLRKLVRRVDRVAVIHPFEPDAYRGAPIEVEFVGHPLVDELTALRQACDRDEACRRLDLDGGRRWIALLPGSRRNEVDRHLPVLLETARRLHAAGPGTGFVLAAAPSVDTAQVTARLRASSAAEGLALEVRSGRAREVMRACDVVITKPGTATVEAMLLERPMVVIGRAHPLTAALVGRLVRVPWLAMPNLLAGRQIVPELLQAEATPARIAAAAAALQDDAAASEQRRARAAAATRLGPGGASQRAAGIAEAMLAGRA